MYRKIVFIGFVFLLAFSVSCKKKETSVPEIIFYSPHENQEFGYEDTIVVHCQIKDVNPIESVKIVMVNSELSAIGEAFYYFPGSTTYELETTYPLGQAEFDHPDNYLLVVADNGTNFKNKYQPILIKLLEKKLDDIIILTKVSEQQIGVSAYYPDGNSIETLMDIDGDYAGSSLSSADQQLYVAGLELLNLRSYRMLDYQLEWELASIPFFPMHNADCLHHNELLFVANNFFNIKAYSASGNSVFTAEIGQNERPGRIFRFNEFLLCDMQSKNGGPTNLVTWYVESKAEKQRLSTIFEVVDYAAVFDDEIFMAVNAGGMGYVKMYNVQLNELTDLAGLPGEIRSMVKTGEGQVLIATGQDIYLYSFPGNYPEVVLPGTSAYRLKFENLSHRLYVVGGNAIDVFGFPQLNPLLHIPLNDSILNIHFHYNK